MAEVCATWRGYGVTVTITRLYLESGGRPLSVTLTMKRVARTCVFRSAACPSTDGFVPTEAADLNGEGLRYGMKDMRNSKPENRDSHAGPQP